MWRGAHKTFIQVLRSGSRDVMWYWSTLVFFLVDDEEIQPSIILSTLWCPPISLQSPQTPSSNIHLWHVNTYSWLFFSMDNPDTMLSGYSTTFSHDEVERRLHIHFCVFFLLALRASGMEVMVMMMCLRQLKIMKLYFKMIWGSSHRCTERNTKKTPKRIKDMKNQVIEHNKKEAGAQDNKGKKCRSMEEGVQAHLANEKLKD